ncbi:sulfurtransferase TusA family protein [Metabacillus sp. FJAT-52054]|uniref:Sulfurtransferase TusA family protein n=1 Tax=Metabacillus sediminis TaxID=3117746 RepID=A0ABZ2NBF1_9BACI
MNSIKSDVLLDAKGLACPMPIVKTKKAMTGLESGQVLEIQATDKGSKADLKAWAESSGHQYIGTVDEGNVLKHFLRKATDEDSEKRFSRVINNEELLLKLSSDSKALILDVREEAEFAFRHIPNAISIPLGELKERLRELDHKSAIYVVCRTGSRSDMAAQQLASAGFINVYNVVPGMSKWIGETTGL